jgi:F-type H+-transporting ATPase subunit b
MELSWETFILEMINFLLLLWILKRFLYQPVLQMIAQRQAAIEQKRHDTEQLEAQARQRQQQFESRLSEWNEEQRQRRDELKRSLLEERGLQLAALEQELQQAREKQRAADASHEFELRDRVETMAVQQAARFATRLLQLAAGPETEQRLTDLLIQQLSELPAARLEILRRRFGQPVERIEVVSAYPLEASQRARINQALHVLADKSPPIEYHEDRALLAGLRIDVGAWSLCANLQDELQGLAGLETSA